MVVLDQHSIVEPEAVTLSAAQPDRPFFKCAQARCGFSRIKKTDRCTFYGFAKLCCQCGDSAQTLHEVQGDALGFENRATIALDDQETRARRHEVPIRITHAADEATVYFSKNRKGNAQTGKDQIMRLFGNHCGASGDRSIEERIRGDVAMAQILGEGLLDDGPNRAQWEVVGSHSAPPASRPSRVSSADSFWCSSRHS